MNNVSRIKYVPDRDMPEQMHKHVYRKLDADEHTSLIASSLDSVITDGNDAHLSFCFTGYYPVGEHYICAVWPEYEMEVSYVLKGKEHLDRILDARTSSGSGRRAWIRMDRSKRGNASAPYFQFYPIDPHLPWRPYLFSSNDDMFSRKDMDNQRALRFHLKNVRRDWEGSKRLVDEILDDCSVEELVGMGNLLYTIRPNRIEEIKNKT